MVAIADNDPVIIIKDAQSISGSSYLGIRGSVGLIYSLGGSYGLVLFLGIRLVYIGGADNKKFFVCSKL